MKKGLLFIATLFVSAALFAQLPIEKNFNSDAAVTDGGWVTTAVTGTDAWSITDKYGVDDSPCAKATAYAAKGGEVNESWLISPAINADNYSNIELNFMSAVGYTGDALTAHYSSDYTGDASTATWTEIKDITWSEIVIEAKDIFWVWTPSGVIDLSAMTGTSVYIGFKFVNSSTEGSATWELDNINITEKATGINDVFASELKAYPTMVTESLTISAKDLSSVVISNTLGQRVAVVNNVSEKTQVNTSKFAKGLYFATMTANNGAVATVKFIKK